MIARLVMPRIPAPAFFLPLAAGLAGFAAMTIVAANFMLDDMVLGFAGGLTVLGLALADQANAWKVPRLLLFLGAASYVIYLTHYAVFSFAFRLLGSFSARPAILSVAVMMALAAGAGGAIHWVIERPILRRLRS
jgi:exopolysaccharide production protein ExoZ